MQIVQMKINEVKPYERNPRRNDNAVNDVAESIKQFGFQQPLVVDKDNVLIVGHTRLKAAKKLGMKEVPVIVAANLSDEQVKKYRILDNKTNELSDWDFKLLKQEILDFNLDFSGFDVDFNFDIGNTFQQQESNAEGEDAAGSNLDDEYDEGLFTETNQDNTGETNAPTGTDMDRIVIIYERGREAELTELLGVDVVSGVVYTLDEILGKR